MADSALYENEKDQAMHRHAISELSRESGLPPGEIGRLYENNLEHLKSRARVKDYLLVLTQRSVKEILRHRP